MFSKFAYPGQKVGKNELRLHYISLSEESSIGTKNLECSKATKISDKANRPKLKLAKKRLEALNNKDIIM